MKFKPSIIKKDKKDKKKEKSKRTSSAVDDHLNEEIVVWANSSESSVASSVTTPASQTASFYQKVLGSVSNFDYNDSVDGLDRDDDQQSFADTASKGSNDELFADNEESSRDTSKKPKKKKKSKRKHKPLRKLFGGAAHTITEEDEETQQTEERSKPRRPRRLSLFGNSSSHNDEPLQPDPQSQRAHSPPRSPMRSPTRSPTHSPSRSPTRSPTRSEDCSSNKSPMGTLQDAPSIPTAATTAAVAKPSRRAQRRSSLGAMFGKKEDLGYTTEPPEKGHKKSRRRASMFGSKSDDEDWYAKEEQAPVTPLPKNRRRRNSLFGNLNSTDHEEKVEMSPHPEPSVTNSVHTTKTATSGRTQRRHSMTNVATPTPPKEIHAVVNKERLARGMEPFVRNLWLDKMARSMTSEMAAGMQPSRCDYHGNVAVGDSLPNIHATIMDDRSGVSRKNILSERFTEFGMAMTPGPDGKFYMVQLFKD